MSPFHATQGDPVKDMESTSLDGLPETPTHRINHDPVKSPDHYNWLPGVECKQIVRHFPWAIGSAIKYLWRWDRKGDRLENLRKAQESIQIQIDMILEELNDNDQG